MHNSSSFHTSNSHILWTQVSQAQPCLACHPYIAQQAHAKTFLHCRKLIKTQLPFPWYQAMFICLVLFTLTFPFICFVYILNILASTVTAFCAVLAFATMNEIANDIEEPFAFYPPKIDLWQFQFVFNERLLAIMETTIPEGYVTYYSHDWSPTQFTGGSGKARHKVRITPHKQC